MTLVARGVPIDCCAVEGRQAVEQLANLRNLAIWEGNDTMQKQPSNLNAYSCAVEGRQAVEQLTNLRNLAVWEGNDAADEPPSWPRGLAKLSQLQDVTLAHFDLVRRGIAPKGSVPHSAPAAEHPVEHICPGALTHRRVPCYVRFNVVCGARPRQTYCIAKWMPDATAGYRGVVVACA